MTQYMDSLWVFVDCQPGQLGWRGPDTKRTSRRSRSRLRDDSWSVVYFDLLGMEILWSLLGLAGRRTIRARRVGLLLQTPRAAASRGIR